MADDQTTKTVLDLDNEDFVSKMKDALDLKNQLGSSDGFDGLIETITKFGLVLGPIAVAILAVKTALDLTKESEHIEQVNNSFKMLAQSAGLAGDALKERLVAAAGGLAGETELLQSANRAIVEMGGNASHIPETMEIARKATALFGGDLISNFDNINKALANGNERMLRQYGIVIDATKAHQDYAKSLGVGVEFLSAAGQKQAVMNAALEKAKSIFKDVDTSGLQVTTSTQKLVTAFKELRDAIAEALGSLDKKFPIINKVIENLTMATNYWSGAIKSAFGVANSGSEKHQENLKKEAQLQQEVTKATQLDQVNRQKIKEARTKMESDLLKIHQDREKADEGVETNYLNFVKMQAAEIETAERAAKDKINQLDVQFHQKGLMSDAQFAKASADIQKKKEDDIAMIKQKHYNDEVKALQNLQNQNQKTSSAFLTSWEKNSKQASADLSNFGKMGDKSFSIVGSQATAAFEAMGNGSKNAGQAMQGFIFGSIGQIAIAQGTELLLSSIWPPNPIGIAAGGALISFGSALSSVGQSTGTSSPSASGSASGGATAADVSQAATNTQSSSSPSPTATQQKSLTVQIQGNIFETDQTRTRLMDLIRQSQDYTDFNLAKIGQS